MFFQSQARKIDRKVNRELSGFNALFPSRLPGICYDAHIFGIIEGDLEAAEDASAVLISTRITLRSAATDVLKDSDPFDVPASEDNCNQHLRRLRPVGEYRIGCRGHVKLSLSRDNVALMRSFRAKLQEQGIEDACRGQRLAALSRTMSDPASFLAWWIDGTQGERRNLPKIEELRSLAKLLGDFPKPTKENVEYQLLDILRAFVASFPDESQKKMLILLVASAFRRASRDNLAEQVELLLRSIDG